MAALKSILLGMSTMAALLLAGLPARAQGLPDHMVLVYSVTYGGIPLGEVVKRLTREGEVYRSTSVTAASGLGRLLTQDTVNEEGSFKVVGERLLPLSYRQQREGSKDYVRTVSFDWDAGTLTFADGHQVPLPQETQDSNSIVYAMMLKPLESDTPQVIHLTDGKRLSRYTYRRAGTERLDTPLGPLDTIRIERRKPDNKEVVTIWVAPARHNLPVKLVKERAGNPTTALVIKSVEGL
jgi:hypothetical protein